MTLNLFNKLSLLKFLLLFLIFSLLNAFSFSNPQKLHQEIKEEIKKELEKIVEKTPSAKLRNKWRAKRDKVNRLLEQALLLSASKFCPNLWDDSVGLFKKARGYAAKREYRKAIYLSKLAEKSAKNTINCAQKYLTGERKKLITRYQKLRDKMDEIRAQIPPGADELAIRAYNLSLAVEDLSLAIQLRQFKDATNLASILEKKILKLQEDVTTYRLENMTDEDFLSEGNITADH